MSLVLFYNLSGIIFIIMAILMICIRSLDEEHGHHFNVAKRYMSLIFAIIGLSMFAAQFEEQIQFQKFEKINALMLLCFYLAGQGILFSLLTLYSSRYASKPYLRKTMLPVIGLFALYTIGYPFIGDIKIYTIDDFLNGLSSPLLILRLIILPAMSVSLIYSMWLCHKAKIEYNQFLLKNFSEITFANGAWLNNLFWWVKALSIWCLLTYFYTTLILEVIVGILMIIVFTFYLKEFHSYRLRYSLLDQAQTEDDVIMPETSISSNDEKTISALNEWASNVTKPYMRIGLTINDVVNETGIPKYRLSHHLNRTEENFSTWINKLRIEEAALLLTDSENDTPLYLIAEQTGFSSLPVFSRTFKKVKGMTPSEYRNQHIIQSLHQKMNIISKE